MKKLLIILILAFAVNVQAAGPISFGGTGTGDMLKADNLSGLANNATARSNIGVSVSSDVQAYSAILGSIAGTATSANKVYGFNNLGALGLYGNFLQDNSAAQFKDAADATKMMLMDPSGGVGTMTFKNNMTATGTVNVPSDFVNGDNLLGKNTPATLTEKILTAPHIQGYEFVASQTTTLFATQAYGGRINNFGQNDVATQTFPTAAYGMDMVFTMGTATSFRYAINAGGPLLYYSGGISTNAWIAAPAVGDYFVVYSFKTGASTWAWILKNGQGTIATS